MQALNTAFSVEIFINREFKPDNFLAEIRFFACNVVFPMKFLL